MINAYNLLLKTGDAEIRALENTVFNSDLIFPIIELTRGRKSKKDRVGKIEKRLDRISKIFQDSSVCIDLTSTESLSNEEIDNLYSSDNGYEKWISFLNRIKEDGYFENVIPTILVDIEDEFLEKNLRHQVKSMSNSFDVIAYRNSIADDGCYEDLEAISPILKDEKMKLIFILDCEYVPSGAYRQMINKVKTRIKKVREIIPSIQVKLIATSFPKNISDIGNDPEDSFPLNEVDIHEGVISDESFKEVEYGDYGSINPIRNDDVVMARGWIPRIDVPTSKEIFYYRERRGKKRSYSDTYIVVAKKIIKNPKFPIKLESNWGIQQILSCADSNAPGSSPSFWISVRMSIHIEQQIRRIKRKYSSR